MEGEPDERAGRGLNPQGAQRPGVRVLLPPNTLEGEPDERAGPPC